MVRDLGATPFDYKKSPEDQVKDVLRITSGKANRIFDAAATGDSLPRAIFKEVEQGPKYFSTTNDWSQMKDFEGGKTYEIALGPIGRESALELNRLLKSYIPVIVALIEKGEVAPSPYDIVGEGGFESAIEALKYQQKGAGGSNKVIVKIADP